LEGIFANLPGFVGSGVGYRMKCNPLEGKLAELISFQPLEEFCLLYDDYIVYKH
jgi:hypothetical protein